MTVRGSAIRDIVGGHRPPLHGSEYSSGICRLWKSVETVSDPGLCLDEVWVLRIRLEFLSKILNDRPKIIDLISVVRAPDSLQKFAMRHGFVRALGQEAQYVDFLRCEMRCS